MYIIRSSFVFEVIVELPKLQSNYKESGLDHVSAFIHRISVDSCCKRTHHDFDVIYNQPSAKTHNLTAD